MNWQERIALFGITGFPPTSTFYPDGQKGGHDGVMRDVMDAGIVNSLWVYPSLRHSEKPELSIETYPHRLEMTRKLIGDMPEEYQKKVFVVDLEPVVYRLFGNTLTWTVLNYAESLFQPGEAEFVPVVGSDHFRQPKSGGEKLLLADWHNREEILKRKMIIVPRPENPISQEQVPSNVHVLKRTPRNGRSSEALAIIRNWGEQTQEEIFQKLTAMVSPSVAWHMINNVEIFR